MNIFKSTKAQLGGIEFKFLLIGLIIGLIGALILVYMANHGALPFNLSFLCKAAVAGK